MAELLKMAVTPSKVTRSNSEAMIDDAINDTTEEISQKVRESSSSSGDSFNSFIRLMRWSGFSSRSPECYPSTSGSFPPFGILQLAHLSLV